MNEAADKASFLTQGVFQLTDASYPPLAMLFRKGIDSRIRLFEDQDSVITKEESFFAGLPQGNPVPLRISKVVDPESIVSPRLDLPSPPQVYLEMQDALTKGQDSPSELSKIISKDTSLTAKLLKLANSAFYGFSKEIESITHAVSLIGTRQLTMLVSGMCFVSGFKYIPSDIVDMETFWKHSLSTGIHAHLIARSAGFRDSERFFVGGLLHDIGRLALFHGKPDTAKAALAKAKEKQSTLVYMEQEELGYDHSTLGSILLREWNIPNQLRALVLYHHIPEIAKEVREFAVIHVADTITRALGMGLSGEFFVMPLREVAWESLNISVEQYEEILEDAAELLEPMVRILGRK